MGKMLLSVLFAATVFADSGIAEPARQSTAGDARVSVAGRVLVAGIEEPVEGALVVVNGNEVVTGPDGRFRLVLPPGTWVISIAAEGFLNDTVTVTVGAGPIDDLQVLLAEARFSETVEVIARGETSAGPAPLPVKPDAVLAQAGVADNVFRTLHTMAGVAAANDFESRISVRGGGPDQNLTVMDGVEIHNPYRLFGLTSAFNPEIVSDFELATGAFSVRHGDRLSSLLTVENRLGTAQRSFGGSASVSITDANLVLEGKLPGRKVGSWLITGRRTYYDLIAERIVDGDLPSFADLQTKVSRELGPGQRLSFTGLLSRESTDASFDDEGESADILTHAENDLVAITFDMPLGVGGFVSNDRLLLPLRRRARLRRDSGERQPCLEHGRFDETFGIRRLHFQARGGSSGPGATAGLSEVGDRTPAPRLWRRDSQPPDEMGLGYSGRPESQRSERFERARREQPPGPS